MRYRAAEKLEIIWLVEQSHCRYATPFRTACATTSSSSHSTSRRCRDSHSYFVSEASAYRLLKARDLIASPAFNRDQGGRRVQG
jgi:hypothetical protein